MSYIELKRKTLKRSIKSIGLWTMLVVGTLLLSSWIAYRLYNSAFTKEPSTSRQQLLKALGDNSFTTPLLAYRTTIGNYPSTNEGLKALISPPLRVRGWRGPYLVGPNIPHDLWGNEFRYRYPGIIHSGLYDLWSIGPDGIDGTSDDIDLSSLPPPPQKPDSLWESISKMLPKWRGKIVDGKDISHGHH